MLPHRGWGNLTMRYRPTQYEQRNKNQDYALCCIFILLVPPFLFFCLLRGGAASLSLSAIPPSSMFCQDQTFSSHRQSWWYFCQVFLVNHTIMVDKKGHNPGDAISCRPRNEAKPPTILPLPCNHRRLREHFPPAL